MKILKYIAAIALASAVMVGLPTVARATTLNFGDSRDLGQVLFGIPSGDNARQTYVNRLISLAPGTTGFAADGQTYNRTFASCGTCPFAVFDHNGTAADKNSVNLGTGGFEYLFAKYDGPNAGSEVWFVVGLTGIITIPTNGLAGQNYGLSGWTLFTGSTTPPPPVPDGGTTVSLLGVALGGLEGLRRMRRARKA